MVTLAESLDLRGGRAVKWLLVILNVAAAAGVIWGGVVVCAIHRVHSYSTYVTLEKQGAFVTTPEKPGHPKPEDADRISQEGIQESLKNIGGLDSNLPVLTYSAAALLLLNAIALSVVWNRKPDSPLPLP
jgi:hypothetical protein